MSATRQAWLAAHPYLEPVARLQRTVEEIAADGPPPAREPRWDSYARERAAGVPLLRSASAGRDLRAVAADALGRLVERLAGAPLPASVASPCRELRDAFRRAPGERNGAMEWIVAGAVPDAAPAHAGLLRFLGWTAARRVLGPAVAAAPWRDEEPWGRGHCPVCGSLPPMSRLVPAEATRPRFLACGCCGTRWRYRRIGCPFCGNEAPDRLEILLVESEAGLRIDVCGECRGYVKTYAGEEEEDLFLSDWPTLHLDVLARDRGLERRGASLYAL